MNDVEPSELVVRAAALYLPLVAVVAFGWLRWHEPRRVAAAVVAFGWNLSALLVLNAVAQAVGWWEFDTEVATVAGIPVELWVGWALLWGAVPMLVSIDRMVPLAVLFVGVDLVVMPAMTSVVSLDGSWLVGEAVAVVGVLVPGLLLGRWTLDETCIFGRAVLQVIGFGGLMLYVVPSVAFAATDESWDPLLDRSPWQLAVGVVLAGPAGLVALLAVWEFAKHDGTPVPLDPPRRLATTGPYGYIANPMQLGASVLLATWGILLASPAVVATAFVAVVFSSGIAAWNENQDLSKRFGNDWHTYRQNVHAWRPRLHPWLADR